MGPSAPLFQRRGEAIPRRILFGAFSVVSLWLAVATDVERAVQLDDRVAVATLVACHADHPHTPPRAYRAVAASNGVWK